MDAVDRADVPRQDQSCARVLLVFMRGSAGDQQSAAQFCGWFCIHGVEWPRPAGYDEKINMTACFFSHLDNFGEKPLLVSGEILLTCQVALAGGNCADSHDHHMGSFSFLYIQCPLQLRQSVVVAYRHQSAAGRQVKVLRNRCVPDDRG